MIYDRLPFLDSPSRNKEKSHDKRGSASGAREWLSLGNEELKCRLGDRALNRSRKKRLSLSESKFNCTSQSFKM